METIEDLLIAWGEWRNRGLKPRPIKGAAMYTPGAIEVRGRYRTRCCLCLGRKIDPFAVGSRIVRPTDDDFEDLLDKNPCPECNGRGYTSKTAMKADPGAIRRTGPGGMHIPTQDTPEHIAALEQAMDAWLSFINRTILVAKYVAFPRNRSYNPQMDGRQARVAWVNQAISPEQISNEGYGKRLKYAKGVLAKELGVPLAKNQRQEQRNAS